jgi:cytochrome c oxidase cbb3-type subunit 2
MNRSIRAAGVIAAVYGYFLIFAQFAWIELMRDAGGNPLTEKVALGSMALAGAAFGFLAARRGASARGLRLSFSVAALAAALSPFATGLPSFLAISLVTGASIGWMTVTLAPLLPRWCSLPWLGLGTGLGYAICNLPMVFMATHAQQAWAGAIFAVGGMLLTPAVEAEKVLFKAARPRMSAILAILAFMALVWLDSAAFFIIQHSRDLKASTWGEPMLWRNSLIHLGVAVVAGFWLKKGMVPVLLAAWAVLAFAAFAVNSPETRGLAGLWYPAGVSLYSTALVAWPGFFSPGGNRHQMGFRAAWLYAVAGWFGSANGIGMAQSLQRVPGSFIVLAGAVVIGGVLLSYGHWRSALSVAAVLLLARFGQANPLSKESAVERGRDVYLAEGCIHCHSRYVRPGSTDELLWGPARGNSDQPILIGNRRQGPDLSQVGARRSATWLKLHFMQPRDFSPDSLMPSYVPLFDGSTRGDDLIAWLQQTTAPDAYEARSRQAAAWSPSPVPNVPDGSELFDRHCSVCHGAERTGHGRLAASLLKSPANLIDGPFVWTPAGPDLENRIARVVKFGVPGTDMPGHETFADSQVLALAGYLQKLRSKE